MKNISLVLGALVLMVGAATAEAKTKIALVGAGSLPQDIAAPAEGKLGIGGGLLAEFSLKGKTGFELGGLYLDRKIDVAGVEFKTQAVHIPGAFRFHFSPVVSLSVGGYYDMSLEDGGENDYGAAGGLRFSAGMGKGTRFLVEGRYNYGLKDIAGAKRKEILALAGVVFGN